VSYYNIIEFTVVMRYFNDLQMLKYTHKKCVYCICHVWV